MARWLPLVEAELAALRARRLAHPELVPELVLAVIAAESGGDPYALSDSNAVGLMQLLPTTFADMIPTPRSDVVVEPPDPFDPTLNIRAGILYLRALLVRHDGDVAWAVAGYHAGIGASARARWEDQPLYGVTLDYVAQVLERRERGVLPTGPAFWAALPPWSPSRPQAVSAPSEALQTDTSILDAESILADTDDGAAGDEETPDAPSLTPTAVPTPPPTAVPLRDTASATQEPQAERSDGRELALRRAPAGASPSPSPGTSPSPTATTGLATPAPSSTPTSSPTSSPTSTTATASITPSATASRTATPRPA
ncbi:MAG TPA: lytic transglycosylase domain-containing protein [Mycobacteriales bacterium]|nr:lytic transglycosylase domain-containing protein [Mycobacteriales bacterium]